MTFGGDGGDTLSKHPDIKKLKKMFSKRMKGIKNPMFGKTHTIEAREKISRANKGKTISKGHKERLSKVHLGKTKSAKWKKKRSIAQTGENNSFYGRHHSEKVKNTIKKANSGNKNYNYGKRTLSVACPWIIKINSITYFVRDLTVFCKEKKICKSTIYGYHHNGFNTFNDIKFMKLNEKQKRNDILKYPFIKIKRSEINKIPTKKYNEKEFQQAHQP